MRMIRAAVVLLLAFAPAAAEEASIQHYLESIILGDTVEQVEMVYPPKKKWPRSREPKTRLDRIELEKGTAKFFPAWARKMLLGLRRGRVARIQVIYDKARSRKKPLELLAVDYSLVYGEPRRIGETYCWWDSSRVLVASNVQIPSGRGKGKEVRTSLELMERKYFAPFNR